MPSLRVGDVADALVRATSDRYVLKSINLGAFELRVFVILCFFGEAILIEFVSYLQDHERKGCDGWRKDTIRE